MYRIRRGAAVACLVLAMTLTLVAPGFVESSTTLTLGNSVARSTEELIGSSYQFGGASPSGFDASGLVMYVYGLYGAQVPRTVAAQYTVGSAVARRSHLRAGDIVLFQNGNVRWTGIYLGNDEVVWASSSARRVVKANITDSTVSGNLQGARRLPDSAFSPGDDLVSRTMALLGTPFLLGTTGPTQFDASGLTQYVHAQAGVQIPRTIEDQFAGGTIVTRTELHRGDLLFFGTDTSSPTMVAVYTGSGRFVFASSSAGEVIEENLGDTTHNDPAIGARRYIASVPFTPPPPQGPGPGLAIALLRTAESFLGTPYVFGATGTKTFDCSSFTRYVFAQHGISLPRTSGRQAFAGQRVASQSQMQKGDLLIFVNTYKEGISHVGIYIGDNYFIHTIPNVGVSYASLTAEYWSERLHSARRLIP